ncbi:hypothetical protein JCM10213_001574 [Rhodosporidiobolus nylandii]
MSSSSTVPAEEEKPVPTPAASIYPSLDAAFALSPQRPNPPPPPSDVLQPTAPSSNEAAGDDSLDFEEGGIRLVSSRSTIASTTAGDEEEPMEAPEDAPPVPSLPLPTTAAAPAFIFGSPVQSPASPPATFSFAMPGSLFSLSTSSTSSSSGAQPSAAELVLAEMNARAAAARAEAAAKGAGAKADVHAFLGVKEVDAYGEKAKEERKKKAGGSPKKGTKAYFEAMHAREFAKMPSIADRPTAVKRTASTLDLSSMARSTSSRTLSGNPSASEERATKRLKPSPVKPSRAGRLPSSSSSKKLVDGLRASGWAAPAAPTSLSLGASIRGGTAPGAKGKEKEVREDVKPEAERERERRKRELEMKKMRRKSQGGSALSGGAKRRPSLIVGPKPVGSTASRFFKSTLKKLTPSSSLASSASTSKPLPSAPSTSTSALPRFASSTASTSSRTAAVPTSTSSASLKEKKQPGWKKFDLQESLKRPMSWKTGTLSSRPNAAAGSLAKTPAGAAPPAGLKRTTSTASLRVANNALLSPVGPSRVPPSPVKEEAADVEVSVAAKLAALPPAPSTAFASTSSSSAPFQPLTNTFLSPPPAPASKPSLAGKKVLSPPSASSGPGKKTASSATKLARGRDKARGRRKIEGLESRARGVKAKASVAGAGVARGARKV